MNTVWFICFILGAGAAASGGPLFFLTFNRAAHKGFFAGFFTGMGAALADAVLFYAGLSGRVTMFLSFPFVQEGMYAIAALLLGFMGIYFLFLKKIPVFIEKKHEETGRIFFFFLSSFFLTVTNPFTLLFFLGAAHEVEKHYSFFTLTDMSTFYTYYASLMLLLGSLCVFSAVAYGGVKSKGYVTPRFYQYCFLLTGIVCLVTSFYLVKQCLSFFFSYVKYFLD